MFSLCPLLDLVLEFAFDHLFKTEDGCRKCLHASRLGLYAPRIYSYLAEFTQCFCKEVVTDIFGPDPDLQRFPSITILSFVAGVIARPALVVDEPTAAF